MENTNKYRFEDVCVKIENCLEKCSLNLMVTKDVTIREKIYEKEESGYAVYNVLDEHQCSFKISGTFPIPLIVKGQYRVSGTVSLYRGERQINCKSYTLSTPTSRDAVYSYLGEFPEALPYMSPLYDLFGTLTIQTIRDEPEKAWSVMPDISVKLLVKWQKRIKQDEENAYATDYLSNFGLSMKEIRGVLNNHGAEIVFKLKENPYCLVGEAYSMSFKKCDKIALKSGYGMDHPGRIREAFQFVLQQTASEGHCFLPKADLFNECRSLLAISVSKAEALRLSKEKDGEIIATVDGIDLLVNKNDLILQLDTAEPKSGKIHIFNPTDELLEKEYDFLLDGLEIFEQRGRCYLRKLYTAERDIADKISELLSKTTLFKSPSTHLVEHYLDSHKIELEPEQYEAVSTAVSCMGGFMIISGGPGCGKTFVTKIIIELLKLKYKQDGAVMSVRLLAPTGKASKVLQQATGTSATTIHRGLGYREDGTFSRDSNNPLTEDLIILDETSMLDVLLGQSFFNAASAKTKIIFVGDIDQLPPIGPGAVLMDLVKCSVIPVIMLKAPKRQLKNSAIVKNAARIVQGEMISTDKETKDFYVLKKDTDVMCRDAVISAVKELTGRGKIAFDDVQVLCPQKSGAAGSISLNWYIQDIFNPLKPGAVEIFKQKVTLPDLKTGKMVDKNLCFRVGDKVIHTQNSYRKEWHLMHEHLGYVKDFENIGITNGECGVVKSVSIQIELGVKKQRLVVAYEGGFVFYEDDFFELEHAFSMTIHKSQGSQWPAVIVSITRSTGLGKKLLTRNLIYTAITRPQRIAVIVGDPQVIHEMIQNRNEEGRNTSLDQWLKK